MHCQVSSVLLTSSVYVTNIRLSLIARCTTVLMHCQCIYGTSALSSKFGTSALSSINGTNTLSSIYGTSALLSINGTNTLTIIYDTNALSSKFGTINVESIRYYCIVK